MGSEEDLDLFDSVDVDEEDENQRAIRESILENVDKQYLQKPEPAKLNHTQKTDGRCERCETATREYEVEVGEHVRYVCPRCKREILAGIDNYYWYDRFTRGHYQIISAYLQSLDVVECVHDHAYEAGEMWVHTKYGTTEVVGDILDYFGSIYAVGIERKEDSVWECVEENGEMFEIGLDFAKELPVELISPRKFALSLYTSNYKDSNYVTEEDRLFD